MFMEETHPQKNYFPDIDLNLPSCVLDSKNGKRSSCVCVCVCEREGEIERPIFFAAIVDEIGL